MLPIMAAQGYGSVVNLGSDAGPVGSSGEAVYSAAMDGVIVFQGHRTQMARHQVNVNCVRLGRTDQLRRCGRNRPLPPQPSHTGQLDPCSRR